MAGFQSNAPWDDSQQGTEYRSLADYPGYWFGSDGSIWHLKSSGRWYLLKPKVHTAGYVCVILRCNGRSYPRTVHRLILEAFVGPRPSAMVCCHQNGDKHDNRIENLRWDTKQQNAEDSRRHGTLCRGETVGTAKLTPEKVAEIRRLYVTGQYRYVDLAKAFAVSKGQISRIVNSRRWMHLESDPVQLEKIRAVAEQHDRLNRETLFAAGHEYRPLRKKLIMDGSPGNPTPVSPVGRIVWPPIRLEDGP